MRTSNTVKSGVQEAAHQAAPWIERLARIGYAAKGVVYLIIGGLALMAAFGEGGRNTDSAGALNTLLSQPNGKFMLGLVVFGLGGYALWRFVQAFLDPERHGDDRKGLGERAMFALSGVVHVGLALTGLRLLMHTGGGQRGAKDWTAQLMAMPLGQWLVGLVALGFLAFGAKQIHRSFKGSFLKRLDLGRLSPTARTWAERSGRLGLAARGIVFGVVGACLGHAAISANPREARGLGESLTAIASQPFGPVLLGGVAAGLFAYGVYMLVNSRYRRIDPV